VNDPKRIYITGCAKSGATLLRRCFWAFEDVDMVIPEVSIGSFAKRPTTSPVLVGKRIKPTIFSDLMSYCRITSHLGIIRDHNIQIVYISRNPKVLLGHYPDKLSEICIRSCTEQARAYNNYIKYLTTYERLVDDPDSIQQEIANALGLRIKHKFSEYPSFVPKDDFEHMAGKDRYDTRPIEGGLQ